MVQMCQMMIFPGVFFNFKILIFQVVRGAERTKNGPKWQKVLSLAPYISGTIYHMIFIYGTLSLCISGTVHHVIVIFGTHVYNDNISRKFFHFSKFWFWGFLGWGKMAKNDLKLQISVYFALYLRNCRSYHQDFDNNIYWCFLFL